MDPTPGSRLLVLHDGKAGNRRQALALVEAWGHPYEEHVLQARAPWRWLAPRQLPGATTAFGPTFATWLAAPPAVAVGCGRQAALATRLLRERGTRVVQILHPRLPTHHWDAVVLPAHDGVSGGNVLTLDGSLNPVDAAWLQAARARHPEAGLAPSPRTLFLVGGPTEASDWDTRALEGMLELLLRWHERDGGSLRVACSRRTPKAMRRRLRQALAGRAEVWGDDTDGANPYEGWLAWAERVVVTPDSANLLSEAAATEALVWVALPRYTRGRLRQLVETALQSGRARALGPEVQGWPVRPWRESQRIAERLAPWVAQGLAAGPQPDNAASAEAAATAD